MYFRIQHTCTCLLGDADACIHVLWVYGSLSRKSVGVCVCASVRFKSCDGWIIQGQASWLLTTGCCCGHKCRMRDGRMKRRTGGEDWNSQHQILEVQVVGSTLLSQRCQENRPKRKTNGRRWGLAPSPSPLHSDWSKVPHKGFPHWSSFQPQSTQESHTPAPHLAPPPTALQ